MKLAEVKRRIQPGTSLTMTWHRFPNIWKEPHRSQLVSGDGVTRPVKRVQGNAITLVQDDGRESWLWWPKASQFQSEDDHTFTILDETDGQPLIRYRINPPAADASAE